MTPDKALAALDELRAAREAGDAAVKATPEAVIKALAAGNTAAEVARRIGMSEGYVRKFRREAGLQDKRYAHLKPPTAESAATPEPEHEADRHGIRSLNAATIRRLAAKAEEVAPDGWAHRVAAGIPAGERPYVLVAAALDEEYLSESQIPH